MNKSQHNILLLGRSGSGKGTQAELLKKELNIELYIVTGNLFREMAKKDTIAGRKTKKMLREGGLAEDWIASFLWQRKLVEELTSDSQSIVFDGVARRLEEAELLDKVMRWFGRRVTPILLEVSRKEACKRLKKRGREDDTDASIKKRQDWYEKEVVRVLNYYDSQDRLLRVNGEPEPKRVMKNILNKLQNGTT